MVCSWQNEEDEHDWVDYCDVFREIVDEAFRNWKAVNQAPATG